MYRGRAPIASLLHLKFTNLVTAPKSTSALCSLLSSLRCRCVHHPVYWCCSSSSGFAYIAYVHIDGAEGTLIRTISSTILIRRVQSRDESTVGLQYNANKRSVSLDSCGPKSVSLVCCVCARDIYGTVTFRWRHYDRRASISIDLTDHTRKLLTHLIYGLVCVLGKPRR